MTKSTIGSTAGVLIALPDCLGLMYCNDIDNSHVLRARMGFSTICMYLSITGIMTWKIDTELFRAYGWSESRRENTVPCASGEDMSTHGVSSWEPCWSITGRKPT